LGVRIVGGGLTPPTPSSVEPRGIPIRPTVDWEPMPVGDEADALGPAKELAAAPAQVPDAVPAVLPPSNSKLELGVPAPDVPIPDVVPELGTPKDACGSELPIPPHDVRLCVVAASGDVPDVSGLTPTVGTSVVPSLRPAGGTGAAGPMPSGDVMPSGEDPDIVPVPPTCAKAKPELKRTAAMATVTKRVIIGSTLVCIGYSSR
jgi:hypothetical protein